MMSDIKNDITFIGDEMYYQGMRIIRLVENCIQCDKPIDTGIPKEGEIFIRAEDQFCDDCWEQKELDQVESEKMWEEFRLKMDKSIEDFELIIVPILQREYLAHKLGGSKLVRWIVKYCPKRWLPTLELPDEENPTD